MCTSLRDTFSCPRHFQPNSAGMSQMDTFKIEGEKASHHNEYDDMMQCEPVNFGGARGNI